MKLNIYNNKQPGHNRFTLQIYSTYVKNNTKYETMTLTYLLIVNLIVHCPNNETVFYVIPHRIFAKLSSLYMKIKTFISLFKFIVCK